MSGKVISTITAKCRDCYKCLRSCPVKAIKLERDDSRSGRAELHARVVEDLCILDGKCVQVCPQKAKRVRRTVVCSVAPSFAAVLPLDDPLKLPTALRRLGFRFVQETSIGAGRNRLANTSPGRRRQRTKPGRSSTISSVRASGCTQVVPGTMPQWQRCCSAGRGALPSW